jgi:hypothetical protein
MTGIGMMARRISGKCLAVAITAGARRSRSPRRRRAVGPVTLIVPEDGLPYGRLDAQLDVARDLVDVAQDAQVLHRAA